MTQLVALLLVDGRADRLDLLRIAPRACAARLRRFRRHETARVLQRLQRGCALVFLQRHRNVGHLSAILCEIQIEAAAHESGVSEGRADGRPGRVSALAGGRLRHGLASSFSGEGSIARVRRARLLAGAMMPEVSFC